MDVPSITTQRLELVSLSPDVMTALLQGDLAAATEATGLVFPATWPEEMKWLLQIRLDQLRRSPDEQPWLLRAIVLRSPDGTRGTEAIGHINFHEPPGENEAVEIGYTIEPQHRRRGFALEAVLGMFDWATREHGVNRFIASVSPKNHPSLRLIDKLGFTRTGVQWDELDGEEIVFELVRDRD